MQSANYGLPSLQTESTTRKPELDKMCIYTHVCIHVSNVCIYVYNCLYLQKICISLLFKIKQMAASFFGKLHVYDAIAV